MDWMKLPDGMLLGDKKYKGMTVMRVDRVMVR